MPSMFKGSGLVQERGCAELVASILENPDCYFQIVINPNLRGLLGQERVVLGDDSRHWVFGLMGSRSDIVADFLCYPELLKTLTPNEQVFLCDCECVNVSPK